MTPSSADPITRIEEYCTEATPIDVDALVRSGRRRRFAQQGGAVVGGVTAIAAAAVGTIVAIQPAGSTATSVVSSASRPRHDAGLLRTNPSSGHLDTLVTTPTGWRAESYVDSAGNLCEGWLDPATGVLSGACGADLLAAGPTNGTTQIDSPLQIEPEAAVQRAVYAFGIAGPDTSSVTVTDRGRHLPITLSNVTSANGEHAFLVRYRLPTIADWVDTATSLDATGTSLGSMMFVAPDIGTTSSPHATSTP